MKPEYVMALDAGTGAARCFLVSLDGQSSYDAYQEWQYSYPEDAQPGGVEFDPENFWKIFATLISRTLQENGISGDQVVGISSTSQREGVVFLDQHGRELYGGPNIDIRAPLNADTLAAVHGEQIYASSGHWPFPMFAPYRLLWFQEHKPRVYDSIATVLLLNDWILYRLSGEKFSEPSNGNENSATRSAHSAVESGPRKPAWDWTRYLPADRSIRNTDRGRDGGGGGGDRSSSRHSGCHRRRRYPMRAPGNRVDRKWTSHNGNGHLRALADGGDETCCRSGSQGVERMPCRSWPLGC